MKNIETSMFKRILALALAVLMVLALSPAQGLVAYAEGEGDEPVTEPTAPGTEPTAPGTEPTEPGTEPTDPTDPPEKPEGIQVTYTVNAQITWDGEAHNVISGGEVTGTQEGDVVQFRLDKDGAEGTWSADQPKVTDLGEYETWVRVMRGEEVVFEAASLGKTKVVKEDYTLVFANSALTLSSNNSLTLNYDFEGAVTPGYNLQMNIADETADVQSHITYSVKCQGDEFAQFNGSYLSAVGCGCATVTVKVEPFGIYGAKELQYDLYITVNPADRAKLLTLDGSAVDYKLNAKNGPETKTAKKTLDLDAEISYELDAPEALAAALKLDAANGELQVIDLKTAADYLAANGKTTVTIYAVKPAKESNGVVCYPAITREDNISYTVNLEVSSAPEGTVILSGTEGRNTSGSKTGWYVGKSLEASAYGYTLSLDGETFAKSQNLEPGDFTDEKALSVYLQNNKGEISVGKISYKYDNGAPTVNTVEVNYDVQDIVFDVVFIGGNKSATVVVTAEDSGDSGVAEVEWKLMSANNRLINSGKGSVSDGKATLTVTSDQARNLQGCTLYVWAYDAAGNKSEAKELDPKVVIDYTDPKLQDVLYNGKELQPFYGKDVDVTFTLIEKNFNPDMENHTALFHASVTKPDGTVEELTTSWTKKGDGQFEGSLTIPVADEGEYTLTLTYTDAAGNPMETYSKSFQADQKGPSITYTYNTEDVADTVLDTILFFRTEKVAKITFTVTDEGVGPATLHWSYKADPKANAAASTVAEGEHTETLDVTGKTGTCTIEIPAEAFGQITFWAEDKLGNKSEEQTTDNTFVVDDIAPGVTVEISTSGNSKEKDDVTYYDKDFTITIKVKEANFQYDENQLAEAKLELNGEEKPLTWTRSGDTYTASITVSEEGEHSFTFTCADLSENTSTGEKVDKNGVYTSGKLVIDLTDPKVEVSYDKTGTIYPDHPVAENQNREYIGEPVTATIKVTEANFDPEGVTITVNELDPKPETQTFTISEWTDSGDEHTCTITFNGDANYKLEDIVVADLAGRTDKTDESKELTVDQTAPTVEKETVLTFEPEKTEDDSSAFFEGGTIWYEFFQDTVIVTFHAKDLSGVKKIEWTFVEDHETSNDHVLPETNPIEYNGEVKIEYDKDKDEYIAKLPFNAEKRGFLTFTFTDFCDNPSEEYRLIYLEKTQDEDGNEKTEERDHGFVADTTPPEVKINLPAPINSRGGKDYYNGDVDATITIKEANFFQEDPIVTLDDAKVKVNWTKSGEDTYTATVRVSGDGDHKVEVSYKDRSNNSSGAVAYPSIIVVDTEAPVITVTGVEHHSANNDDTISLTVTVSDRNIFREDVKVTLKAIVRNEKGEYETKTIELGEPVQEMNGENTVFRFTIDNLELDGYYMLTAEAKDMSGHTVNAFNVTRADEPTEEEKGKPITEVNFTVNREGSVFWVETKHNTKDHPELIENQLNGNYVNGDRIIVQIHEINVDPVDTDKENQTVLELNNGFESKEVTLTEGANGNYVKNEPQNKNSKGWYECVYTLDESYFKDDGEYSVNLKTVDTASNTNLNTNSESGVIHFVKDSTLPAIVSSVPSGTRVNAQECTVQITITDANLDLDSLHFFLDGQPIEVTKLDANNYTFVVGTGLNHSFSVEAADLAGNVAEPFTCDRVTVSTNILVLWYANTPLFIGSVAGTAAVAGGLIYFFVGKKKKKEEAYAD